MKCENYALTNIFHAEAEDRAVIREARKKNGSMNKQKAEAFRHTLHV